MSVPLASAANKVLQTRALQCSFSSVFHLRRAGMCHKDADFVENLFVATVGVPIAIMGATGLWFATNSKGDCEPAQAIIAQQQKSWK